MPALDNLHAALLASAAGQPLPPVPPSNCDAVRRILLNNPHMRQLLQTIATRRPDSISQLAEMTGRAQPNVTRAVALLEAAALVVLVPAGRARRPSLAAGMVEAIQYFDLRDPSADRLEMKLIPASAAE